MSNINNTWEVRVEYIKYDVDGMEIERGYCKCEKDAFNYIQKQAKKEASR